jgi:lantibiotic leader peptide-processing serine protease
MSLGGALPRSGFIDENGRHIFTRDVQAFINIYSSVAAYAQRKGTTIIAAAGNESVDANHTADLIFLPAQVPGVVAVSALGPQGWILNPFTNLDVPAFYTNSGSSLVTVSAPGGNIDFALVDAFFNGTDVCVGVYGVPCYAFDLVFSTDAGGWSWKAGTSMATPHAAGVAALIVSANGGSMSPGALRSQLKDSADDLGPSGSDAFFGVGRVNALRAVTE